MPLGEARRVRLAWSARTGAAGFSNHFMRIFLASLLLAILVALVSSVIPGKTIAAPLATSAWQLHYGDEFNSTVDLAGWNCDRGDGNYWIDTGSGFLHLESNWGYTYPMLWRNDLFKDVNASNLDYAVEVRFRRASLTAYGSAFGIGSAAVSQTRFPPGDTFPPNNYENVLTNEQHQPIDGFGGHERICMHQPGKPIPVDYAWHVGRVEFVGTAGLHYFDGELIGTTSCHPSPVSIYFGNTYAQSFVGAWTPLDIDYVRIYISPTASANSSIYLPFILK